MPEREYSERRRPYGREDQDRDRDWDQDRSRQATGYSGPSRGGMGEGRSRELNRGREEFEPHWDRPRSQAESHDYETQRPRPYDGERYAEPEFEPFDEFGSPHDQGFANEPYARGPAYREREDRSESRRFRSGPQPSYGYPFRANRRLPDERQTYEQWLERWKPSGSVFPVGRRKISLRNSPARLAIISFAERSDFAASDSITGSSSKGWRIGNALTSRSRPIIRELSWK